MSASRSGLSFLILLVAALACRTAQPINIMMAEAVCDSTSLAVRDTAAIRSAAAAHFSEPDSAVQKRVMIRADTAWVTVYHGRITFTVVRLLRSPTGWRFDREVGYGIH